jgi:hypothetical protein
MGRYTETHRTTGDGYSVAIYRDTETGKWAVQECESAFLPSKTVRLEWVDSLDAAWRLRDTWVDEGREKAVTARRELALSKGFAIIGG